MKMLKTKHFRRLAVFLAMIAPAVYLFGSLFSALTGAHGVPVFAQSDEQVLSVDVNVARGVSFNTDTGEVIPGYYASQYGVIEYLAVSSGNSYTFTDVVGYSSRLFKYDSDKVFTGSETNTLSFQGFDGFVRLYLYSPDDVIENIVFNVSGDLIPAAVDASSYSDYIFKEFFAKNNFLVQWGENAISENPHGFAPFGAFWRYLDTNVLHLSNDQVGLMGYGYMYYAAHVLLFDVGFILVTFFLDFIQRIADKFTGGE